MSWLADPDKWVVLADRLRAAGEFGIDTETWGQPDGTSPQHRARIHCWSVGVLSTDESPRGFRRAVGVALPRLALDCPALRAAIADPGLRKWAHNAPHDHHALRNEGVEVGGLEDSLQWLRVATPGVGDYGLKGAEQWALGYGPRPTFMDLMRHDVTTVTSRGHTEKGCVCGTKPCRARASADWLDDTGVWRPHTRVSWKVFTPVSRVVEARYQVPDFVPGAALDPLVWGGVTVDRMVAWWDYVRADAIRGMELVDWLRRRRATEVRYPWTRTSN